MNAMKCRQLFRFAVVAALICATLSLTASAQRRGRKYKAAPPTSRVEVTVLRGEDGHPVENAAVIFHLVGDKGNMELKTNEDGKTMIDVLPTGSKVLLQVLAKGYQTYGGEYNLDKANMTWEVKLSRPGKQYSIYDKHAGAADAKAPAGAAKDAVKDGAKPDESAKQDPAKQDAAKPESSQPQPQ
jgi:hypothetical protein